MIASLFFRFLNPQAPERPEQLFVAYGRQQPGRLSGAKLPAPGRINTKYARRRRTIFHVATRKRTRETQSRATETEGEEASDEGRPLRSFRSSSQVEESEMPTLWVRHGLPWWKCAEMGMWLVQFY